MYRKQRIKIHSDHFCVQKTKNKTLRSLLCTDSKEQKKMKNKKINQIIVVYTKQRIKNSDVRCNRRPSNKSEKPNNTCMNDSCHKLCGNIHQGERLPHHRFSNLFNVRRVEWVIFFCVCVCVFGPTCCPTSCSIAWILTDRTPLRL